MKNYLEISENRDLIITSGEVVQKDSNGEIIWADIEANIAKSKGKVKTIYFYETVDQDEQKHIVAKLTREDFMNLAKLIESIEAHESSFFYD